MIKEEVNKKIIEYCKDNNINFINIRNMKKSGKTRIVLTCLCNECNERYDVNWETIKRKKYKGLCTYCSHTKSAEYKKITVEEIIKRFEKEGYKVLTPIKDIKPRGKKLSIFTIRNRKQIWRYLYYKL